MTTFKILLVGETNVGKSSIMLRFCDNSFSNDKCPTIGVDFKLKWIASGNMKVKLALWDTAGQERYRTLTPAYYRGAQAVIFVYDVTSEKSFRNLDGWVQEVEKFSTKANIVKMVVGNKIDTPISDRAISRERGLYFARCHKMLFLETSAKSSLGIDTAFEELVEKIIETPSLYQIQDGSLTNKRSASSDSCSSCKSKHLL